jgi:hypothetical protein
MTSRQKAHQRSSPVTQEHSMGCGLACVAFIVGKTYQTVWKKVPTKSFAWTRGYYCKELVALLSKFGASYEWKKVGAKFSVDTCPIGTIIFLKPNQKYPMGHFMVKIGRFRYMNPWKNFPIITPAKSGFVTSRDEISYVIEPEILSSK